MSNPFDLSGQVAVITGSSKGIGRAAAEIMASLGAKVVVSSRKAAALRWRSRCRSSLAGPR
jgi:NAD(P)-dependent dehydrogenase (short-subunit alcohol dehydrogenase family)